MTLSIRQTAAVGFGLVGVVLAVVWVIGSAALERSDTHVAQERHATRALVLLERASGALAACDAVRAAAAADCPAAARARLEDALAGLAPLVAADAAQQRLLRELDWRLREAPGVADARPAALLAAMQAEQARLVARLERSLDEDRAQIGAKRARFFGLILLAALAGGTWTAYSMRANAARLLAAFRQAERGDLDVRLPAVGKSEFREAADAFNRMVARLQATTVQAEHARAQAERALARMQLVTEASGLGWWYFDHRTGRHEVDARYAAMLGETPAAFADRDAFAARLHPEDFAPFWAALEAHEAGHLGRLDLEYRLRHRDGSWRWIAGIGQVVARDPDGRPLVMAGTHRDVTELHAAQTGRET